MSGLGFDNKFPAVISSKTHSKIDYIHAGVNLIAAALFWKRHKRASILAMILGGNVLANSLMTDYELGVFRLYSFKTHGLLDYGVAAASEIMPSLLRLKGSRARFFHGQGGCESVVAGLSNYNDESGAKCVGKRVDDKLRSKVA